jgi:hypothetical protein
MINVNINYPIIYSSIIFICIHGRWDKVIIYGYDIIYKDDEIGCV